MIQNVDLHYVSFGHIYFSQNRLDVQRSLCIFFVSGGGAGSDLGGGVGSACLATAAGDDALRVFYEGGQGDGAVFALDVEVRLIFVGEWLCLTFLLLVRVLWLRSIRCGACCFMTYCVVVDCGAVSGIYLGLLVLSLFPSLSVVDPPSRGWS